MQRNCDESRSAVHDGFTKDPEHLQHSTRTVVRRYEGNHLTAHDANRIIYNNQRPVLSHLDKIVIDEARCETLWMIRDLRFLSEFDIKIVHKLVPDWKDVLHLLKRQKRLKKLSIVMFIDCSNLFDVPVLLEKNGSELKELRITIRSGCALSDHPSIERNILTLIESQRTSL